MKRVTKKQLLEKIEKVEGMLAEHMNLPLFEELKGKIFSQNIRYSGGNEEYCFEILIPFRPSKLLCHISCVYLYIPLTKHETVENFDKLKLVENFTKKYIFDYDYKYLKSLRTLEENEYTDYLRKQIYE